MLGFKSEYRYILLSRTLRQDSFVCRRCCSVRLRCRKLDRRNALNPKTLQLTTHAIYEPKAKINSSCGGSLRVASHIPSLVGEIVMHIPAHEPLPKHLQSRQCQHFWKTSIKPTNRWEGQRSQDKSSRVSLTNAFSNSCRECDIVTNSNSDSGGCPRWCFCAQRAEYSLAIVDLLLGPARNGMDTFFSILAASGMTDSPCSVKLMETTQPAVNINGP